MLSAGDSRLDSERTVVAVPVTFVPSTRGPIPVSYHLYVMIPVLSGLGLSRNETVAIPVSSRNEPLVVAADTGCFENDK